MIGWHFATRDETLGYGDGRPIIVGQTHSISPPVCLCERGLHASDRIIDALKYAPGPILYRVELFGTIIAGSDKAVATHRRYIARLDATDLLDRFARACALSCLHQWEAPDVVVRFLCGDGSARDAARAAARDAAWAAAWAAVWAAAWAEQNTILTEYALEAIGGED